MAKVYRGGSFFIIPFLLTLSVLAVTAGPVRADLDPATVQKLLANDGATEDYFGYSVAVSGDTALVGAYGDDDKGSFSGSAYVFVRSGTAWIQQQKLTPNDGAENDCFGWSVAISGDTALVGADSNDENGSFSGSAYVFVRSGNTWTQQQKLTADDGASYDYFGSTVSVSGDTALVGVYGDNDKGSDSGSAYVFVRNGTTWTQQQKLTAGDGAAYDWFGGSVSISGDTALVGAYGDDDNGSLSGSAYVFIRSGTAWTQQQKLTPNDGAEKDYFGYSVSVSGDTVLVSADSNDDKGSDSGSAYVFVRSGTAWTQQQKLTAADGAAYDYFGCSVAIDGDTALVGAYGDKDNGLLSGSAYMFVRSGTAWTQQQKLTLNDGEAYDWFGWSMAVSGDTALVGAYGDRDNGLHLGSAYVYVSAGDGQCEQDLDCPSGNCVDGYCCDSQCDGTCESCSLSGYEGICTPVPFGEDPDQECGPNQRCGDNQTCKAQSGQSCSSTDNCLSGSCVDGYCCDGQCDDTCETCGFLPAIYLLLLNN